MKKNKKLKLIGIIIGVVLLVIIAAISFYLISLRAISKDNSKIIFTVKQGSGYKTIVEELYEAGIIRNKYAGFVYVALHSKMSLKAGSYEVTKSMRMDEILKKIASGNVLDDIQITFIEGRRLNSFVKTLTEYFSYTEEDILGVINNKDFLYQLINNADYWFLTDEILTDDIYYPLEGYLFPDTYIFKNDATIESIIKKMLDNTTKKLVPYKEKIDKSEFTVHEILSMAAIVELEGNTKEDRKDIAQVIYNRIKVNMSLGMDVTTYYAVQKEMGTDLYKTDFNTDNAYNTRGPNMAGKLPVGPICNPSLVSIDAVINPTKNDYLYFIADILTGKVYFTVTNEDFQKLKKELG